MRDGLMIYNAKQSDRDTIRRAFSRKYTLVFAGREDRSASTCNHGSCKVFLFFIQGYDETRFSELRRIMREDAFERPVVVITEANTIEVDRELAGAGIFCRLEKPYGAGDLEIIVRGAMLYWSSKRITPWEP